MSGWRKLDISSFFSRIAQLSMREYEILEKTRFSELLLSSKSFLRIFEKVPAIKRKKTYLIILSNNTNNQGLPIGVFSASSLPETAAR
jgi:hypothetical protein